VGFSLGDQKSEISRWLRCKMESEAQNAKEIETYAFLLGSAIRNEDTDQFLSIYDSILPSGLSEKQVL